MRKFLINIITFALIGSFPVLILLTGYFVYDPFKVLHQYNDYSYSFVIPNRDYISTEMLIKNREIYHYDSYIFGSSRTLAFRPSSWKTYLQPDASPFVFDASSESMYGIYHKLKYLQEQKANLKNVLIVLCRDVSFTSTSNFGGHLFIKHPATSGESKLYFHLTFIKSYFSPKFLGSFYDYTFTGKFKPYMENYIEQRQIKYDTITNVVSIIDQEDEISSTPDQYYLKRAKIFYERSEIVVDTIEHINEKYLFMLGEIKRILELNKTNYKIVISPLYEQIKFSSKDFEILKNYFGDNVYDFSGKNRFTDSITNYYEASHYRPSVGDSILEIIYRHEQ